VDFRQNLVNNGPGLLLSAVLKHSLNNSAAIGVHTQLNHVVIHWLQDEVEAVRGHLLNALLNHMISILVINAVKDGVFELRD
jgi:hypothetical protein